MQAIYGLSSTQQVAHSQASVKPGLIITLVGVAALGIAALALGKSGVGGTLLGVAVLGGAAFAGRELFLANERKKEVAREWLGQVVN